MKDNFPASLAHVLASEGGFCDDAQDPGGATNKGITQRTYDLWRVDHGQETRDVRDIDPNEVECIYKRNYWDVVSGDELPSGVDYCVFDASVNSGPGRAAKWLQQAIGVTADGKIGPVTLEAVNQADPRRVIATFSAEREAYLTRLPTFVHFGNGWLHRVASVEIAARGMA